MASTRHRGDLSPICLKPTEAANRAKFLSKLPYYKAPSNTHCPKGKAISKASECAKALKDLKLGDKVRFIGDLTVHNCAAGCLASSNEHHHHFNSDMSSVRIRGDLSPICKK